MNDIPTDVDPKVRWKNISKDTTDDVSKYKDIVDNKKIKKAVMIKRRKFKMMVRILVEMSPKKSIKMMVRILGNLNDENENEEVTQDLSEDVNEGVIEKDDEAISEYVCHDVNDNEEIIVKADGL